MSDLLDRQWELTNTTTTSTLLMGPQTDFVVSLPDFNPVEIISSDAEIPGADGLYMGRDYRSGRVISFDLAVSCWSADDALEKAALLESAWLADDVRFTPGAVSTLRYRYAGRTRTLYGRPRRFYADNSTYSLGVIKATADFQCVDHISYGDSRGVSVDLVQDNASGVTWPLDWPIVWGVAASTAEGSFTVAGTQPSWLPFTVYGPIQNPTVSVVGQWSVTLNLTLNYDEWVDVDPRPWNRSVRKNGQANVAGAITPGSTRLSELRVVPGTYNLSLSGTDVTRTARVSASVQDCFAGF